MDISELDKSMMKGILKTSEGMPTQHGASKAKVKNGEVSPSRSGHPVSSHVSGASGVRGKTKFGSMDDAADALWETLNTREGRAKLQELDTGRRVRLRTQISANYSVEASLDQHGKVRFSKHALRKAGIRKLSCVAILEVRSRAGRSYLHVHTFYPALNNNELSDLLKTKTNRRPPRRRGAVKPTQRRSDRRGRTRPRRKSPEYEVVTKRAGSKIKDVHVRTRHVWRHVVTVRKKVLTRAAAKAAGKAAPAIAAALTLQELLALTDQAMLELEKAQDPRRTQFRLSPLIRAWEEETPHPQEHWDEQFTVVGARHGFHSAKEWVEEKVIAYYFTLGRDDEVAGDEEQILDRMGRTFNIVVDYIFGCMNADTEMRAWQRKVEYLKSEIDKRKTTCRQVSRELKRLLNGSLKVAQKGGGVAAKDVAEVAWTLWRRYNHAAEEFSALSKWLRRQIDLYKSWRDRTTKEFADAARLYNTYAPYFFKLLELAGESPRDLGWPRPKFDLSAL